MDIAFAVHVGIMKISLYADDTLLTNLCRSPVHILFVKKIVWLIINIWSGYQSRENFFSLISYKMYLISFLRSVWSDIVFSH